MQYVRAGYDFPRWFFCWGDRLRVDPTDPICPVPVQRGLSADAIRELQENADDLTPLHKELNP